MGPGCVSPVDVEGLGRSSDPRRSRPPTREGSRLLTELREGRYDPETLHSQARQRAGADPTNSRAGDRVAPPWIVAGVCSRTNCATCSTARTPEKKQRIVTCPQLQGKARAASRRRSTRCGRRPSRIYRSARIVEGAAGAASHDARHGNRPPRTIAQARARSSRQPSAPPTLHTRNSRAQLPRCALVHAPGYPGTERTAYGPRLPRRARLIRPRVPAFHRPTRQGAICGAGIGSVVDEAGMLRPKDAARRTVPPLPAEAVQRSHSVGDRAQLAGRSGAAVVPRHRRRRFAPVATFDMAELHRLHRRRPYATSRHRCVTAATPADVFRPARQAPPALHPPARTRRRAPSESTPRHLPPGLRPRTPLHSSPESRCQGAALFIEAMERDRADRGLADATERAAEAVRGLVDDGPVKLVNTRIAQLTRAAEKAETAAAWWQADPRRAVSTSRHADHQAESDKQAPP
ncbi:hypothetical protein FQR65_LT20862 [Abscondita terminalis]|nr:hypothetical protein FQR65_LT20862 [Abscondita terminalis]